MLGLANELVDREQQGDWWLAEREAYPTWLLGSTRTLSAFEIFGAVRLRVRPGRVVVAWHIDYSDDRSLATAMDNLARLAQPRRVRSPAGAPRRRPGLPAPARAARGAP